MLCLNKYKGFNTVEPLSSELIGAVHILNTGNCLLHLKYGWTCVHLDIYILL